MAMHPSPSRRPPSRLPQPELSLVIPVFNEEQGIPRLLERVTGVLNGMGGTYELVFVDDGSRDGTLDALRRAQAQQGNLRIVELTRNFGKEIALSAGLDHATGKAVVVIDADLQDPPELIPDMVQKWREGYDAVYATRLTRQGESWFKRATAAAFYWLINKASRVSIPRNTGDFRLLDQSAVEALRQLPEHTRFMKGLFMWVGFRQTAIHFDRPPRASGRSKWNWRALFRLAMDGLTSFSSVPLQLAGFVGMLVSLAAFAYLVFLLVYFQVYGRQVPGYASLMVVMLFLGGLQLFTLGVIGEYLGRVFEEVKRRPLYLVRRLHGFGEDEP
jgi:polyisoprenyl-phosphate glycosyltransferase